MIAFADVIKSFGDRRVLNGMTLDMAERGITCLLGASGCGKSTALRVAAGLIATDAGSLHIPAGSCGVVLQDSSPCLQRNAGQKPRCVWLRFCAKWLLIPAKQENSFPASFRAAWHRGRV